MNKEKEDKMKKTKLICPSCSKDTGYTQEQFKYTLTEDIECPHCFEVVIEGSESRD